MGTLTTVTVTDAPFGAVGDGKVRVLEAGKTRPEWHGQYTVGVDTLDYIGIQEAIYAAFGAPGKEHGSQNPGLNVPLYIPSGMYVINKPLRIARLMGGRVMGAGRLATKIVQATAGTPVLTTNGISFSRIEGIAFHAGGKTNFRGRWKAGTAYQAGASVCARDGSIWRASVGGTSDSKEPAWGGSPVHDGAIAWERVPPFALVTIDWDASGAGGWTGACQSNSVSDCHFSGENTGVDFGVAIAPTGGNSMGSENLFTNCFFQWFTTAGFVTMGFNALQNTIVGGNFEGCMRYAVWFYKGAGAVYSTGFQNGFTSQIAMGGYDIAFSNSTDDASVVFGCRTESGQFVAVENNHKVSVRGCAIVPPMAVWSANVKWVAGAAVVGRGNTDGVAYYTVDGGTSGATEPVWDASKGSIVDGAVTWVPMNYAAISGGNVGVDDCVVCYGQVALRSNVNGNGHVHGCSFSRPDWMVQVGNGQYSVMNNVINLAGGPDNSHGAAAFSVDPGVADAPMHRAPLALGGDAAILFPAAGVSSVGIVRGDARRDILGVYGAVGRPTASGANVGGGDLTLIGGLSAGAGMPGRIVMQTGDAGPAGAVVNEPATRFTVSAAGVTVGAGGPRIQKLVATSVAWRPGQVGVGKAVGVSASLYGVRVGDVVGVGFSGALPAGCLVQATVTAPGKVRVELFNLSGTAVSVDAGRVRLEAWLHGARGEGADDIAQLVADVGDVAAIYDARVGVAVGGDNVVSRWSDARGGGGGVGPVLTATGMAPAYNGVAGTIIGRGVGGLASEPAAAFDLSRPLVMVFVGSVGRGGTALSVANGERRVTVEADPRGVVEATIDGRTQVSSGVGGSGATRMVAVTAPAAGAFGVQVLGGDPVSQHVGAAFPGGGYALSVAGGVCVVRAVVVVRGALEGERLERLGQWAAAVHGAESVA